MTVAKTPLVKILGMAVLALAFLAVPARAEKPPAPKTLENLLAAYNGESNAQDRYQAFAKKADEEGYAQAASLFRAAARAEQVHLERHAKVIVELGGTAIATIETPVVKSTRENIEDAFKGETYESQTMYPEFIAQAEKDKVANAVDAFEDAKAAEGVHAQLYEHALKNLETMKNKKIYYLCSVCGNVIENLALSACPICEAPTTKFMLVN